MDARNELMEQYADAVFALAMDAVANEEGEALLRENARLKSDPDFRLPEQADLRCRKTIVRGFRRRRRKRALRAAGRTFQRVSVVVLVLLLLLTGVYAARPESRTAPAAKSSDSIFAIVRSEIRRIIATKEVDGQLPYEFDILPEGFVLAAAGSDGESYWKYYKNDNDERIHLTVIDTSYGRWAKELTPMSVKHIEAIQVNGNEGTLQETYGTFKATICDETHNIVLDITFYGLDRDDVLHVLTGLTYTGVDFYGTPFHLTFDETG